MDNRARATAADLHDRLIGFKSSAGGPFRGFGRRMDGMEAQVSSHSPSFLLKVGHFSHLLWLRCCAVQWRFRWFPLPNLKLLEFFSFSPLPLSPCQMPPRSTTPKTPPPNRAKKEEKKVCRSADHDRLSPSPSLPSFLQSIFVPFAISKRKGKTRRSSFPSILIIVRDAAGTRNGPVTVSRYTNCQLYYHSWSCREPPSSRNALANRD